MQKVKSPIAQVSERMLIGAMALHELPSQDEAKKFLQAHLTPEEETQHPEASLIHTQRADAVTYYHANPSLWLRKEDV